MKTRAELLIILWLWLSLSGCNNDEGGHQPALGVKGVDLSGTYLSEDLKCFDSEGALTASAMPTGYSERLEIQGNAYKSFEDNGNCSATSTGTVVFAEDGTAVISGGSVSVPAGSCEFTMELTPWLGGTIVPSALSTTWNEGGVIAAIPMLYQVGIDGELGLYSNFAVDGSPGDNCFLFYRNGSG